MMAVQQALADCQMVVPMLSCQSFWNPSCTNLWNPSWSWMIPYTEPLQLHRLCTTSLRVTHLLPRIMAQTHSVFSSVADVDGCPDHSSVTLVWLCLNMVIHSHIYFTAVKHCFHIVLKIYNGLLPLVHLQPIKIVSLHTAVLWCYKSGAAMLTMLQH
jgi:hypothetical protein